FFSSRRRHTRSKRDWSSDVCSSDLFGAIRALVRAVRDDQLLGGAVAARLHAALPAGVVNGWQYAAALFLGLVVLGNYGPGDQRRSEERRVGKGCRLRWSVG